MDVFVDKNFIDEQRVRYGNFLLLKELASKPGKKINLERFHSVMSFLEFHKENIKGRFKSVNTEHGGLTNHKWVKPQDIALGVLTSNVEYYITGTCARYFYEDVLKENEEVAATIKKGKTVGGLFGFSRNEDVRSICNFVVDIDSHGVMLKPEEYRVFWQVFSGFLPKDFTPQMVVYTGRGLQLYYRLDRYFFNEGADRSENQRKAFANDAYKALVAILDDCLASFVSEFPAFDNFSVDKQTSCLGFYRFPGSFNGKAGVASSVIETNFDVDNYNMSEILDYYRRETSTPSRKSGGRFFKPIYSTQKMLMIRLKDMSTIAKMRRSVVRGSRQQLLCNTAVICHHLGFTFERTLKEVSQVNVCFEKRSMTPSEVREAAKSGYDYGSRRAKISNRSMSEFLQLTTEELEATSFSDFGRLMRKRKRRAAWLSKRKRVANLYLEIGSFRGTAKSLGMAFETVRKYTIEYREYLAERLLEGKKKKATESRLEALRRLEALLGLELRSAAQQVERSHQSVLAGNIAKEDLGIGVKKVMDLTSLLERTKEQISSTLNELNLIADEFGREFNWALKWIAEHKPILEFYKIAMAGNHLANSLFVSKSAVIG